ncbi:MAG: dephospho-CoA kinase [Bacilli bacterium]
MIGITGSIATGKTTVTTYLKEKGYLVLDADEIVKEEKKPNKLIYKALINKFDRKILNSNNEIDDKKLAQFIYESEHNRQIINKIIHPIVYDVLEDEIVKAPHGLIFVSVPLMFEASLIAYVKKSFV